MFGLVLSMWNAYRCSIEKLCASRVCYGGCSKPIFFVRVIRALPRTVIGRVCASDEVELHDHDCDGDASKGGITDNDIDLLHSLVSIEFSIRITSGWLFGS